MQPAPNARRALFGSAAALVAYFGLGRLVSPGPPPAIDREGRVFFDHGDLVAWVFTESCFFTVLAAIGAGLLVFGAIRRDWAARVIVSLVTLVTAWQANDALKLLFHRPRPPHWVVHHESSFSYSSGHATLSLVFYGMWALFVWRAELAAEIRKPLAAALFLWVIGVGWSRLALGAHYVTDVIGGYLIGAAWLCIAFALAGRFTTPQPR